MASKKKAKAQEDVALQPGEIRTESGLIVPASATDDPSTDELLGQKGNRSVPQPAPAVASSDGERRAATVQPQGTVEESPEAHVVDETPVEEGPEVEVPQEPMTLSRLNAECDAIDEMPARGQKKHAQDLWKQLEGAVVGRHADWAEMVQVFVSKGLMAKAMDL